MVAELLRYLKRSYWPFAWDSSGGAGSSTGAQTHLVVFPAGISYLHAILLIRGRIAREGSDDVMMSRSKSHVNVNELQSYGALLPQCGLRPRYTAYKPAAK